MSHIVEQIDRLGVIGQPQRKRPAGGMDHVVEGPERPRCKEGLASAHEYACPMADRVAKGAHQRSLADTGLAGDEYRAPMPGRGRFERAFEFVLLRFPFEEEHGAQSLARCVTREDRARVQLRV